MFVEAFMDPSVDRYGFDQLSEEEFNELIDEKNAEEEERRNRKRMRKNGYWLLTTQRGTDSLIHP